MGCYILNNKILRETNGFIDRKMEKESIKCY